MRIEAVQTRALIPPQDDLLAVLDESLPKLADRSVVVVSSKAVAIGEGRCVEAPRREAARREKKRELARRESELFLEPSTEYPYRQLFTITGGVLRGAAGIDASNGNGYFVLLPKDSNSAAQKIRAHIMRRDRIAELGVIVTDSRTTPMRNGTIGVALGYAGFRALRDYRGMRDIFNRAMRVERMNVADSLATAANVVMGEGNEQMPLAVCTELPQVVFTDEDAPKDALLLPSVPMAEDVFAQFFAPHPWRRGGTQL